MITRRIKRVQKGLKRGRPPTHSNADIQPNSQFQQQQQQQQQQQRSLTTTTTMSRILSLQRRIKPEEQFEHDWDNKLQRPIYYPKGLRVRERTRTTVLVWGRGGREWW